MRRNGIYKKCEICGKEFYVQGKRIETAHCCSQECSIRFKTKLAQKPCLSCGCMFKPHTSKQKYCSRGCMADGKKKGRLVQCRYCKREFWVMPCQLSQAKYCSRKCADAYKKNDNYFKCKECGRTFYSSHQRQFCCQKCARDFLSREASNKTLNSIKAAVDNGEDTIESLAQFGVSSSYASKILLKNPGLRKKFKIHHSFWEDKFEHILNNL